MTNPQNLTVPQTQTPKPTLQADPASAVSSVIALPMQPQFGPSAPSQVPACRDDVDSSASTPVASAALNAAFSSLAPAENALPRRPRNGKIAHLPKPERDLVNRMLANNLPHSKIVNALDDCGFYATVRNISNWKTRGGYKEWCAVQSHALELRNFQDNLTDFLRRHDASELPEVGLQSAATSLSALLLRPDLIRELAASPEKYAKLIEIQCRLAREIQALQKNRDETALALGRRFNPERLKRQNEEELEGIREVFSSEIGERPGDPNTPHRNFIPKQLDPAPPVEAAAPPLDLGAFLRKLAPTAAGATKPQQPAPASKSPSGS